MKKALKLLSNNSVIIMFLVKQVKEIDSHFVNQTINMLIHMTSLFNAQS